MSGSHESLREDTGIPLVERDVEGLNDPEETSTSQKIESPHAARRGRSGHQIFSCSSPERAEKFVGKRQISQEGGILFTVSINY